MTPKLPGARCHECPLQHTGPACPGSIPKTPSGLAIISDHPDADATRRGIPFQGSAGKELDSGMKRAGWPEGWRSGAFISHVIACKPAGRMSPAETKAAYEACSGRLAAEVAPAGPQKALLIAGKMALRALTGKTKIESWVGGVYQGPLAHGPGLGVGSNLTTIPTYNPARVTFEPILRGVFRIHLQRLRIAHAGRLLWSWPKTVVGRRDGFDAVRAGLIEVGQRTATGRRLLGHDVETGGIKISSPLTDYGLAVADPAGGESDDLAVTFDWRHAPEDVRELARGVIRGAPRRILQNGQFDALMNATQAGLNMMELFGGGPGGDYPFDDTMHAHQTVAPLLDHDLGYIVQTELPHPRFKSEFKSENEELWLSEEKALERAIYNARDAWSTARIWPALERRLKKAPRGMEVYGRLLDEIQIAYRMRARGVCIDVVALEKHDNALRMRVESAESKLSELATEAGFSDINPRSNPQMAALFEALGAPSTKFSDKTGAPSYNAAELARIAIGPTAAAPVAKIELQRREFDKLRRTYTKRIPDFIDPDGCIRPSGRPGLVSGRWAYSNPGVHQMPKELRDAFVASPGHVFLSFDLVQAEPWALAILSQDPAYLKACASGKLYEALAVTMFGRSSVAAVTPGERQMAKRTNLAVSYGAGAAKLEASLKPDFPSFSLNQAERLKKDFFSAFPGVRRFQLQTIAAVAKTRLLIDPDTGLTYPQPAGPDPAVCANQPIQVGATWVMRQIVADIAASLPEGAHPVLYTHDELVVEAEERIAGEVLALLRAITSKPRALRGHQVAFPASFEVGPSWGWHVALPGGSELAQAIAWEAHYQRDTRGGRGYRPAWLLFWTNLLA